MHPSYSFFRAFARQYVSATPIGSGNNYFLCGPQGVLRGRMYVPVQVGGTFPYCFAVQNLEDSTFADGSTGVADRQGGAWRIRYACAGDGGPLSFPDMNPVLTPVLFDGQRERAVAPGEVFATDAVSLTVPDGHYLCFEWEVEGGDMPYTPDKTLSPSFLWQNGAWVRGEAFPQPVLFGVHRDGARELTLLGDSITQGLGTPEDRYAFYAAEIARRLAPGVAVRNLGMGHARAADAAGNGVWLAKAAAGQTVSVCLGVNDILQAADGNGACRTPEQLTQAILRTLTLLRAAGCRVGLALPPPFDWAGEAERFWRRTLALLQEKAAPLAEWMIHPAAVWGLPAPQDALSRFGSHPDERGAVPMAELLLSALPF